MSLRTTPWLLVIALLPLIGAVTSTQGRADYLELAKAAYERGLEAVPAEVEAWRARTIDSDVWGYGAPGGPVWLANLAGGLHEITGEERYALEAAKWMAGQHLFKDHYPDTFRASRPEYANGLPTLTDFFQLPVYCQAYLRIRSCDGIEDEQRAVIERSIAESAEFIFDYPEWGPMNRAMLRAEGLLLASIVLPEHPHAADWKKLARILADDSQGRWEEEDAQIYHPVWVNSLLRYGETSGDTEFFDHPAFRYYFAYLLHLLSPAGMIPEFGDARWNENWAPYVALFERGAALYGRPDMKWAAQRIFRDMTAKYGREPDVRIGMQLLDAYRWSWDELTARAPTTGSEEVLEDLVGKKIVFRSGWEPTSTYLMLNYRDEGDYARVPRDFLRLSIPVEEEKMHHGHSDENAICLLMDGGSVLLNESGYRDAIPSGLYGRFRADYFHNRLVTRRHKRGREQPLLEFLHNSGAYHSVRTEKIEFIDTENVDVSRTRLTDERTGVQSDRVLAYVKDIPAFVVVDVVKFLETDYYTLATLWHATTLVEEGEHHYVTAIDSLYNDRPRGNRALLIDFLQQDYRDSGTYPIHRQHQDELAVYQAVSSHYHEGQIETFVTVLVPHERGTDVAPLVSSIRLLEVDDPRGGVCVEITSGGTARTVCVKTDLDRDILARNERPRYTFESGRIAYGPFDTDASFLYAERTGDTLAWFATHMVRVLHDGRELFSARPQTFGMQPDDLSTRYGMMKWRFWDDTIELD